MREIDIYAKWRHMTAALLSQYHKAEAKYVARELLEDKYGLLGLSANKVDMSRSTQLILRNQMKRLLSGEPLQYVLGRTYFVGRKFYISPKVLIPRPETEELTVRVIRKLKELRHFKVLDVGTGSGCIAVSLALAGAEVVAIDISREALRCARRNVKALGAKVKLQQRNVLHPIKSSRCYDVLISNPPYVPEQERIYLSPQVRDWEPKEALFVQTQIHYSSTKQLLL